jgi:hypothetical protein
MTRQTILSMLALWLVLMSMKLQAGNSKGIFRLKEGDWFEIQVKSSIKLSYESSFHLFKKPDKLEPSNESVELLLCYRLNKQLINGNQVYNVTIKRIQAKTFWPFTGVWLSYDSYYPPYQENLNSAKKFIEFNLEVKPNGDITRFDSIAGFAPEFTLTEISPKRMNYNVTLYSKLPIIFFKLYSNFLMLSPLNQGYKTIKFIGDSSVTKIETKYLRETALYNIAKVLINDSIPVEINFSKDTGVPCAIGDHICLTRASFPIPANTIIKGKLKDQVNKEITISLEDDGEELYFTNKKFSTDNKGTFFCPIFLKSPLHLTFLVGDKSLKTFMEPGDTLDISAIGYEKKRIAEDGSFYEAPEEYFLAEANKLGYFSGNAAYNTMLSNEIDQWMPYMPAPENIKALISFRQKASKKVNELFIKYSEKASKTCIDYFKTKWDYYLAADKLYFFDVKQTVMRPNDNTLKLSDYPADFFLEVDTMPVLLHPNEWCQYYNEFIHYSQLFKQQRLGMSVGGLDNSFYGNYFFAQASLKGLPLYKTMAKAIDEELRKGFASATKMEPFYLDFINNCNDPILSEPLKKLHEIVLNLSPGKTFPPHSFMLKDSSFFDLSKYKGKTICLIITHYEKKRINDYKEEIGKFKPNEVEFIFVTLPNNYSDKTPPDSSILALPNVQILDAINQGLKNRLLVPKNKNKIFILDKWLRIVKNESDDPRTHISSNHMEKDLNIEQAIKKAINVTRYSKEEKTAIFKTAGWSLGSILFAFLIGWLYYRRRIRNIKKLEAVKRQIKELEIKAIRSQMNPHFIFNALNSIQSLINRDQYKEANIYLAKFAVLLRGVLNNSEKNMISLSEELQAVKLYCELEQLRFDFKLLIEVADDVKTNLIEIPGMIIQPLAENAIVHGISPKGENGLLTIKIDRQHGDLCVYVSDNGVGLPSENADTLRQKGFGLKLVEERIAILNYEGKSAKLSIDHKGLQPEETGTTVKFTIPID